MRLFLLPISTRRSLIYCERASISQEPSTTWLKKQLDRVPPKVNETWAGWERAERGWKKQLTLYGNQVFKRIPYEEWGLKSIPPLTAKRKANELDGNDKIEVLFPGKFLKEDRVMGVLELLATERQALHKKRMWWSALTAPLTAPFMLVPVIPNIPFFYLVFRAWSHMQALNGSKHLEFLVQNKLIKASPSTALDELYTAGLTHSTREISRNAPVPTLQHAEDVAATAQEQIKDGREDVMLLKRWNGKLLAERFELPEMEVEIERAVEQVEKAIKAKEALKEERSGLDKGTEDVTAEKSDAKVEVKKVE